MSGGGTTGKVAAYCRVSGAEQAEKQTIEAQVHLAEARAALEGVALEFYLDDGVSGFEFSLAERPAGARLLQAARERRISLVWITKLDRLGRNAREILNAVHELEQAGCRIVSLTEPFDTSSAAGRFLLTMLSGVAELERANIRERMMAGHRKKARHHGFLGGEAPYGYRVEGERETARIVPDEEPVPGLELSPADVMRRLYRWIAEERLSCYQAANRLNTLGVPAPRKGDTRPQRRTGQPATGIWTCYGVWHLVSRPTYKGVWAYAGIERQVPPLVDANTWERARTQLTQNSRLAPKNRRRFYLLRGLIHCTLCGSTYVGRTYRRATGTSYSYYACSAAGNPARALGKCGARVIPILIEDAVWSLAEEHLQHPERALAELALSSTGEDARPERARVEALLNSQETERARVVSLYRRGRITDGDLDRQLDEIDTERARLLSRRAELEAEEEQARQLTERTRTASDSLTELRSLAQTADTPESRRRILEELVDRLEAETVREGGRKRVKVTVVWQIGGRMTLPS